MKKIVPFVFTIGTGNDNDANFLAYANLLEKGAVELTYDHANRDTATAAEFTDQLRGSSCDSFIAGWATPRPRNVLPCAHSLVDHVVSWAGIPYVRLRVRPSFQQAVYNAAGGRVRREGDIMSGILRCIRRTGRGETASCYIRGDLVKDRYYRSKTYVWCSDLDGFALEENATKFARLGSNGQQRSTVFFYRSKWAENDMAKICPSCGKTMDTDGDGPFHVHADEMARVGGSSYRICNHCAEALFRRCHTCGTLHAAIDMFAIRKIDGNGALRTWVDICEDCNAGLRNPSGETSNLTNSLICYCESCREEYLVMSPRSNPVLSSVTEIVTSPISNQSVRAFTCPTCLEAEAQRREHENVTDYKLKPVVQVYSYHRGPDLVRKVSNDRNRTYGFELEMEQRRGACARMIAADFQKFARDGWLKYENDGSLCSNYDFVYGPENISCPMDIPTFDKMPLEEFCEAAVRNNFVSHNSENCGMHVHIGLANIRFSARVKLDAFINWVPELWVPIARRDYTEHSYCRSNSGKRRDYLGRYNYSGDSHGSRYEAVNFLTSGRTMELRIFRGTLAAETIRATLYIVDFAIDFVGKIWTMQFLNNAKGYGLDFLEWIAGLAADGDRHALVAYRYMLRRGLYQVAALSRAAQLGQTTQGARRVWCMMGGRTRRLTCDTSKKLIAAIG